MDEERMEIKEELMERGQKRVEVDSGTGVEEASKDRIDECAEARALGEAAGETTESVAPEAAEAEEAPRGESSDDLRRLLEEKEEQLRREHDRWMRTYADYENYKKRAAREKASQARFGNEALLRALLAVIDNLERSLAHAEQAQNLSAVTEGVEMVRRELLRTLESFGLKMISAQAQPFDPTVHEAVSLRESTDYPENTVIEEVQKGYCLYERLLRPSRVVVAKAPQPQEP